MYRAVVFPVQTIGGRTPTFVVQTYPSRVVQLHAEVHTKDEEIEVQTYACAPAPAYLLVEIFVKQTTRLLLVVVQCPYIARVGESRQFYYRPHAPAVLEVHLHLDITHLIIVVLSIATTVGTRTEGTDGPTSNRVGSTCKITFLVRKSHCVAVSRAYAKGRVIHQTVLLVEDIVPGKRQVGLHVLRIPHGEDVVRTVFIGLLLEQMTQPIQQVACRLDAIKERHVRPKRLGFVEGRERARIAPTQNEVVLIRVTQRVALLQEIVAESLTDPGQIHITDVHQIETVLPTALVGAVVVNKAGIGYRARELIRTVLILVTDTHLRRFGKSQRSIYFGLEYITGGLAPLISYLAVDAELFGTVEQILVGIARTAGHAPVSCRERSFCLHTHAVDFRFAQHDVALQRILAGPDKRDVGVFDRPEGGQLGVGALHHFLIVHMPRHNLAHTVKHRATNEITALHVVVDFLHYKLLEHYVPQAVSILLVILAQTQLYCHCMVVESRVGLEFQEIFLEKIVPVVAHGRSDARAFLVQNIGVETLVLLDQTIF